MAESGKNGIPIFHPHEPTVGKVYNYPKEPILERWGKKIIEPDWERAWAVLQDGKIIGHLDLKGPKLPTELHRAVLGIGVEQPFHGMGLGSLLTEAAIAWAKTQPSLAWIDLYVFSNNSPAIRLYQKKGFQEKGRVPDKFRIAGEKIEDIHMTLHL